MLARWGSQLRRRPRFVMPPYSRPVDRVTCNARESDERRPATIPTRQPGPNLDQARRVHSCAAYQSEHSRTRRAASRASSERSRPIWDHPEQEFAAQIPVFRSCSGVTVRAGERVIAETCAGPHLQPGSTRATGSLGLASRGKGVEGNNVSRRAPSGSSASVRR